MRRIPYIKVVLAFAVASLIPLVVLAQGLNQGNSITFRSFKSGNHSQFEKPQTRVLMTQGDFQRFWSDLTGEPPSAAPRDIDWNKEILVAVALGQRPTSGYRTFVKSIERTRPSEITVTYVERQPPAGQILAQVITSPWEIVRLPRVSGNISFERAVDNGLGGITIIDVGGGKRCGCNCGCGCCR